jgi:hypothetical protein
VPDKTYIAARALKAAHFLPVVTVFRSGGSCRYLPLFERMWERRNYVSDGCRFALLFNAGSGTAVVYRNRSAGDSSDTTP